MGHNSKHNVIYYDGYSTNEVIDYIALVLHELVKRSNNGQILKINIAKILVS